MEFVIETDMDRRAMRALSAAARRTMRKGRRPITFGWVLVGVNLALAALLYLTESCRWQVNLLLALLCCQFSWGLSFAGLNLVLALFNLLPIGRLDGGRALYCTLALLAGPGLAAGARSWLDLLCTAAALAAGLALAAVWGNVTLLLAGLWMLAVLLWDKFGRRRG